MRMAFIAAAFILGAASSALWFDPDTMALRPAMLLTLVSGAGAAVMAGFIAYRPKH
jgi:hypothetical protein